MAPTAPLRFLKEPHFVDAARAAGVAALLALPLLGFRLVDSAQGLSLGYRFSWVVYAALAVFLGRLALFYSGVARRMTAARVLRIFPRRCECDAMRRARGRWKIWRACCWWHSRSRCRGSHSPTAPWSTAQPSS